MWFFATSKTTNDIGIGYLLTFLGIFRAPKSAVKRVFLVTDEDDPHNGSFELDAKAGHTLGVL